MAYGYLIAKREAKIITLHDCDIKTYSREILARLCHPIANPYVDFAFCKGYYARVTDRIHGRATRLYVTPLLRSLKTIVGHLPVLDFLDSFRYPLSGEFAMSTTVAGLNRIPGDWGLEIGVLAESFGMSASSESASRNFARTTTINTNRSRQAIRTEDCSV